MNRELIHVIEQIGREKGIDKGVLFEALESALLSASKKGVGATENIRLELDRQTGELRVFAVKRVVEKVTDPKIEMTLAEAQTINPDAKVDEEVSVPMAPREFGRIAAQTAKQVILQRVREAEREGIFHEFSGREGSIIRGLVQRVEKRNLIMELGKAEGILPEREQIPGERHGPGDRVKSYVLEVKRTSKGPQIILSRTHPGFLLRLFEQEVPEIGDGLVLLKGAAREPGERAKVAVISTRRDVDPVGACVGLRGTRIQTITKELRGEKIDIIEWVEDLLGFVTRALAPAKVSSVSWIEGEVGAVLVVVPDTQLSLAIGKRGQNARLAAKLTGLRVDIKSESELEAERQQQESEAARGREALAEIVGEPGLIAALVAAGLGTPRSIVQAGLPELLKVPGLDELQAQGLLRAAFAWVEAHPSVSPPPGEEAASETEAKG